MIMTTTHLLDGYEIEEYCDVICAEHVVGTSAIKDLMANIVDFMGGRAYGYESTLYRARESVKAKLFKIAEKCDANAIIGIDFDYSQFKSKNGMVMISISGTAVKCRQTLSDKLK